MNRVRSDEGLAYDAGSSFAPGVYSQLTSGIIRDIDNIKEYASQDSVNVIYRCNEPKQLIEVLVSHAKGDKKIPTPISHIVVKYRDLNS